VNLKITVTTTDYVAIHALVFDGTPEVRVLSSEAEAQPGGLYVITYELIRTAPAYHIALPPKGYYLHNVINCASGKTAVVWRTSNPCLCAQLIRTVQRTHHLNNCDRRDLVLRLVEAGAKVRLGGTTYSELLKTRLQCNNLLAVYEAERKLNK
jgi:hypothetical protein